MIHIDPHNEEHENLARLLQGEVDDSEEGLLLIFGYKADNNQVNHSSKYTKFGS
jgi:hypothetical protein